MDTERESLLPLAKRKLRIDGADTADDQRITEIIESSEVELCDALALPEGFTFMVPGSERELLLARVFYEWHDALDDFEDNYAQMLATTRERWIARTHAEAKQEDPVL